MKTINALTTHLTQAGYEKLVQELEELRTVRRPHVQEHIRSARDLDHAVETTESTMPGASKPSSRAVSETLN